MGDCLTNSWFQACTRWREPKPPRVKARSRFMVAADRWYPLSSRSGSGIRASGSGSAELAMSPR